MSAESNQLEGTGALEASVTQIIKSITLYRSESKLLTS
jgi:hypothetical protein